MKIIKICGITSPEMANFAALAGADMIGIMQHRKSKRYVSTSLGAEIALAASEGGAEPVAVFFDENEEEIFSISKKMNVKRIQVYRKKLPPSSFKIIYADFIPDEIQKENDYLLFDSSKPGSGISFDWSQFKKPPEGMKWFLAGGLNAGNVRKALLELNPDGLDTSSGVEVEGKKNKDLITEFIQIVRKFCD